MTDRTLGVLTWLGLAAVFALLTLGVITLGAPGWITIITSHLGICCLYMLIEEWKGGPWLIKKILRFACFFLWADALLLYFFGSDSIAVGSVGVAILFLTLSDVQEMNEEGIGTIY